MTLSPSREEIADVLALAPPYRTLESRKLYAALDAALASGLAGSAYVLEIEEALKHAEPREES